MIITHTNPDMDAVAGVWLLKRFGGLDGDEVKFVNTGNPDQELLAQASAVVDTGKQLNATRLRFDHHHLPGNSGNDTCAARQVYEHLLMLAHASSDASLDHLMPLIELIFAGDTGRKHAKTSRELGLHAIFSGWKAWFSEQNPDARLSDETILAYGFGLLDVLEVRLRKQSKARAELKEKTVYISHDGLVWAIRHGSAGSSFAAYDEGARIVVFEGEPIEVEGGITYPVGIMRAGEWQEPHVGNLVEVVREGMDFDMFTGGQPGDYSKEYKMWDELGRWFLHRGGFFAGRGTAKAPIFEPVEIDIVALAQAIDVAWRR